MKIEWLIADVISVGSLDRAEREMLVMILNMFSVSSNQAAIMVGAAIVIEEPLCDLGIPF